MSATDLAIRMGYLRESSPDHKRHGDTSRVLRLLNIIPQSRTIKHGRRYGGNMKVNDAVAYDVAVRLAEALDLDPHEAGV